MSAININVDSKLKEEATHTLNNLGLNMTTAITLFLKQVVINDAIPFEIKNKKPTRELKKSLKEANNIINGKIKIKTYNNVNELMEDLEN